MSTFLTVLTAPWLWRAGAILIGIAIAVLSFTPSAGPGSAEVPAHILAYGVWTAVAVMAARSRLEFGLLAAAVFGAGALIEIIQPFFGRSGTLDDVISNGIGVGVGMILGWLMQRFLTGLSGTAWS